MPIQPISHEARQSESSSEELLRQVDRISRSRVFESSQTSQRLLRYLATKSAEAPGEQIKEYTIGVEALQRRSDFNPEEDTIVRVQIYRLREKLLEYYKGEGIHDPFLITIPKGHYSINCEAMKPSVLPDNADSAPPAEVLTVEEPTTAQPGPNSTAETPQSDRSWFSWLPASGNPVRRLALLAAGAAVIAGSCFVAGWWLQSRVTGVTPRDNRSQNTAIGSKADPMLKFWAAILGNDSAPVIAYADEQYLVDDSNDLFPYMRGPVDDRGAPIDPSLAKRYAAKSALVAKAGALYYENGYTGTGDLQGVAALESFFSRLGVTPTVKSSRSLTTEDLRKHCVILLGATNQNNVTEQLPTGGDFAFGESSEQEGWRREIVNLHPSHTDAATYKTERDPITRVLKADYGLVAIQPGIVPGRFTVTLVGLDTTGTEGAALFATSHEKMNAVLNSPALATNFGKDGNVPLFQALIHVKIANGSEVLGESLVTVHPLKSSSSD